MNVSLISTDNDIIAHGIRSISAVLKENGHSTRLVLMPLGLNNKTYSPDTLTLLQELVKDSPVIGVTSMTLTAFRAKQVIEFLKEKTDSIIVFGGAHATIMPEECIEYVDVLCLGDGECAMLDLVNKVASKKDYSQTPNLWVKQEGSVRKNPVGNLVEDLDEFFMPDFDLRNHYILKNDDFVGFTEELFNGMHSIHTMRGCPHSCTYCCNNFFRKLNEGKGKVVRQRSVANIISELSMVREKFRSIKKVWITDDTFIYRSQEELLEFSRMYKSRIKLPFGCYVSPKTLTDEKLAILVDAGLTFITIGIQSGSDEVNRKLYKRMILSEDVLKTAEMLKKYQGRITLDYQLIITNPYEDEEDVLKTIDLVRRLPKPFVLETFNLAFFRGTELYEKAVKDNMIKTPGDTATDLHFYDLMGHLKRKKGVNYYLNSLLFSMNGRNTDKRHGYIPSFMLGFLTTRAVIRFNNSFRLPTTFFNYLRGFIRSAIRLFRRRMVSG
ncbi:MAG: B12-binding domain-containing radical SAM protein [Candidatus Altiarchaeota archaeon]|nr:B12-binding domain-containing radical SAM protein [Candidatus Altiarchaeota archaeon]